MGFLDGLAKVGKAIVDEAKQQQGRRERDFNNAQSRASRVRSDSDLVKRFQNSSGSDKVAYGLELENRGYIERGTDGKYKRTDKNL